MEETDMMLKWCDDLKEEIGKLPFHEDDIRVGFFGSLHDVGYSYYRGFVLFDLSDCINDGKVMFDGSVDGKHFIRTTELSQIEILSDSYYHSLNRNLLISSWSNFEFCVNTFCKAVTNPSEKDALLAYQYNNIKKMLKKTSIDPEEEKQLKETLIAKDFAHVPIVRKTDCLFKKANGYSRVPNDDKEFLLFMGKFRNTIHSNFIYSGKDYEYTFQGVQFVFKNNEKVKWSSSDPKIYFQMMTLLKEIWTELINNIEHKEIIFCPGEE